MNKIKALFIAACLLSIASVANASTVSPMGTAGSQGTITLDSTPAIIGGLFGGSSVFYDLIPTNNVNGNIIGLNAKAGVGFSTLNVALYSESGLVNSFNAMTDTFIDSDSGLFTTINAILMTGVHYYLQLSGAAGYSYNVTISEVSAVPVPAAGLLFASALFGAGALGRRKKKTADTSVVGAFARAS